MATSTAKENLPYLDLRAQWLDDHARQAESHARFARRNLAAFKGSKSTPYARSIRDLAEAHEEAAAVYRRRIEELEA